MIFIGEGGEEETPERDDRDSRSPSVPPRSGSSARIAIKVAMDRDRRRLRHQVDMMTRTHVTHDPKIVEKVLKDRQTPDRRSDLGETFLLHRCLMVTEGKIRSA